MKKLSSIIIILILSFLKLHAQCVISGNLIVCVGSTTQLSGTGTPVETDPWLSQSIDVATISNTGLVTGIQAGTSLITYTTTDCFSTVTVTVLDWVNPTFSAVGPYCVGASPDILPTTSTNSITGSWSPSTISTASAGTTEYIFTPDAGSCTTTATLSIIVTPPVTPAFTSLGPYCIGALPGTLPSTSTNFITGNWSPSTVSTASAGTTIYTFTPDEGLCANVTTMSITINSNDITPSFAGLGPYCVGATPGILQTTSANVITGSWSPSTINTASAGTTVYTFTPTAGQCAITTTMSIVVNANVTPTFTALGPYCVGATPGSLLTTSLNEISGTWSPASISTASAGTSVYTFTPTAGQCGTTTIMSVIVNANLTPTFTALGPYCVEATPGTLPGTSANGITGTWNPATISTASTGTTVYTFTPTGGQCVTTATMSITVNANLVPTFAAVGPNCSGAAISALPTTSTNGITGTWSPAINNTATTTYTFTPTAGQCATSTTLTITIIALPATPAVGTITQPTCAVGTGSVILTGLPSSGTWTLTRTPGGTTTTGTGTSTTVTGIPSGTYTYTVTNSSGCISSSSASVAINTNPSTPAAPIVGTITQPTCATATGSIVLNGLPSSGTWTLARIPGGVTMTGTGTSTTISGLAANTYTFTVTNESGCTSAASGSVVINAQPLTPTAPTVGTITQPTCTVATGGVALSGLPSSGTWTLTRTPGGTTTTGTGTSTSVSGLSAGTYTFTVTNASGCISSSSNNVVINSQPSTPSAPIVGTITDPGCTLATGSVALSGLPSSGTWTITRTPGSTITTGTGTGTTISGIPAGTFTFTVTNAAGCSSTASGNAVINAQPPTPTAPVIGTITQPTLSVPTGSVVLSGLPATGAWTLTRTPGGTITAGTGLSTTISGLAPGTYTFTVTNASGCTSLASDTVGLFTLKLYGPDQNILHSNDIIKIDNSDAGSISINVESNTDWAVSENSLWFKAVKESGSSKITVTYLENISAKAKVEAIRVSYTSNPDFVVNIQQKARVSQLNNSKFENIKIYPNPANDIVYLNFGEGEFEKVLISITNIQGFTMSTKEYADITSDQIIELNVSELPVGQYLISIGDGIHSKSFHLIKY